MTVDRVVSFLLAHRKLVLGVLAIATLASLLPYAGLGPGGVHNLFDFRPESIFASDDESFATLEEHHEVFGRGDTVIVCLISGPGAFADETLEQLPAWTQSLAALEGVDRVDSLATMQVVRDRSLVPFLPVSDTEPVDLTDDDALRLRNEATAHPLLAGGLVATDGSGQALIVTIDAELRKTYEYAPIVDRVRDAVEGLPLPDGTDVHLSGLPVIRPAFFDKLFGDQATNIPIAGILFVIVLSLLFRDVKAVGFALLAVGVACLWTMGFLFGTGETLNVVNNVMAVLIFVIAIADGIHLLDRYRHETTDGADVDSGIRVTMTRLAKTCFVTSLTTALGFASLGIVQNHTLASFGIYTAIGIVFAYVAVVLLLPLSLSFFPPLRGTHDRGRISAAGTRFLTFCADLTIGWPKSVAVLSLIVFALFVYNAAGLEVESHLMEGFDPSDPMAVSQATIADAVGGVLSFDVQLRWDEGFDPNQIGYLEAIDSLKNELTAKPGIGNAIARTDLLREANLALQGERSLPETAAAVGFIQNAAKATGSFEPLFRPDERVERITARIADVGGQAALRNTLELETQAADLFAAFPEIHVSITGDGPTGYRGLHNLITDLWKSLLAAIATIFVVMLLLLRSIRVALVSMIPNVLPLLAAATYIAWSGGHLRATSVIVFAIALGLAVDDTIHFLVRFREEFQKDRSYEAALRRSFDGVGRAILATTVLLAVGYSVILFSAFPISAEFALLLEIAVIGAVFADLLLLPALLILFRPFGPGSESPGSSTRSSDNPDRQETPCESS